MAALDLSWKTFRPAEGFYTSEVATPRPWPIRTFTRILPARYFVSSLQTLFLAGDVLSVLIPDTLALLRVTKAMLRLEPNSEPVRNNLAFYSLLLKVGTGGPIKSRKTCTRNTRKIPRLPPLTPCRCCSGAAPRMPWPAS